MGAEEFLEELERNQLRDIAASSDERTRLHFRDKLLEKLIPKKIETRTEGTQQMEVRLGGEITDLLRQFWAAEQADNAETRALGEDDSGEEADTRGSPPN